MLLSQVALTMLVATPHIVITIAVSSQKGGVGKTTVSINLAHAYARMGQRTLLVDADPQGSVGLSLTRQSRKLLGFYDAMGDPSLALSKLVVPTRMKTFSMVPAGKGSDYELGGGVSGALLKPIRTFLGKANDQGYDVCIVDTAAGLFGISSEVISACDAVIVPQQAEPLGVRSVPKMLEELARLRKANPKLTVLGIVMTMVQRHLAESVDAVRAMCDLLPPEFVFQKIVPRDDLFVKASARGLPVGLLDDASGLVAIFDALRGEIDSKLTNRPVLS